MALVRPVLNTFLGALLSVTLVVTLATVPAAAEEPATDPFDFTAAEAVVGEASEELKLPEVASPSGEFDGGITVDEAAIPSTADLDAPVAVDPGASVFDDDTSVVTAQTEFSTTYRNENGTNTARSR